MSKTSELDALLEQTAKKLMGDQYVSQAELEAYRVPEAECAYDMRCYDMTKPLRVFIGVDPASKDGDKTAIAIIKRENERRSPNIADAMMCVFGTPSKPVMMPVGGFVRYDIKFETKEESGMTTDHKTLEKLTKKELIERYKLIVDRAKEIEKDRDRWRAQVTELNGQLRNEAAKLEQSRKEFVEIRNELKAERHEHARLKDRCVNKLLAGALCSS